MKIPVILVNISFLFFSIMFGGCATYSYNSNPKWLLGTWTGETHDGGRSYIMKFVDRNVILAYVIETEYSMRDDKTNIIRENRLVFKADISNSIMSFKGLSRAELGYSGWDHKVELPSKFKDSNNRRNMGQRYVYYQGPMKFKLNESNKTEIFPTEYKKNWRGNYSTHYLYEGTTENRTGSFTKNR